MYPDLCRTEVCTLLLCHGADPTLVNCHSKTAIDLAPSEELKQRIDCKSLAQRHIIHTHLTLVTWWFAVEFKGHIHLEYAHKGDVSKMKKTLTSKLANFQHPQTQDTPLVCLDAQTW